MRSLRSHDTLVKIRLMDKHTISCSHTSRIPSSASFQIPPTGTYPAFPSHLSDRHLARRSHGAAKGQSVLTCSAPQETVGIGRRIGAIRYSPSPGIEAF